MAGSGAQTIILFTLETKSPPNSLSELPSSNTSLLLLMFRFHIHYCSSHPPPLILLSCCLITCWSPAPSCFTSCSLTIIFTMPPHCHAVVSGLVGPNGTLPMWPDPIIPNGTPDPELVTIGADFKRPTRGLVRPCCLCCTKAMINNPALMCHCPTWWVNYLHYYQQHDKCHNVSAPVSILALLICCIGPEHLFPNPALSAGGGGRLARGQEALGPNRLTCVRGPPCKCGTSHQGHGGLLRQPWLDIQQEDPAGKLSGCWGGNRLTVG